MPTPCASVRSNEDHSQQKNTGHTFFSESQYSSYPYLVQVTLNSVSFVHRGTHVVERRFVFPGRVLQAVLTEFVVSSSESEQPNGSWASLNMQGASRKSRLQHHLCVLVRSDCLSVFTASGDAFEVALPFQATRLFSMSGKGLLLERSSSLPLSPSSKRFGDATTVALARKYRRASTSNRGDGDRYRYSNADKYSLLRPRYFTLRHPLDEVKPVVLSTVADTNEKTFIVDSALEAVNVLEDATSLILVTFNRSEQAFCVFRINMFQKLSSGLTPKLRLLNEPTRMKQRSKCNLEEVQVPIEPDWVATLWWKSPFLGPRSSDSMLSSPTPSLLITLPVTVVTKTSSMLSSNDSKVAFIASDVDNSPLLCLMDKHTGSLLLKPITQREIATESHSIQDRDTNSFCIVHCRDAAPIKDDCSAKPCVKGEVSDFENFIDIVVLENDGALVLYKAQHPICQLLLPDLEHRYNSYKSKHENSLGNLRFETNEQLIIIDEGQDLGIVYPDLFDISRSVIWRCEHPLKMTSSLLAEVFRVLDYVVPSDNLCLYKAHIICSAQQKAQMSGQEDDFAEQGLEWQAFVESILGLLPQQKFDNEEKLLLKEQESASNVANIAVSSPSFDMLCGCEFHDTYHYVNAALFASMEAPATRLLLFNKSEDRAQGIPMNSKLSFMNEYLEIVFAGLHMLCEEFKLSITHFQHHLHLAKLLLTMALRLELHPFISYYEEDNRILQGRTKSAENHVGMKKFLKSERDGLLCFAAHGSVPDILLWLQDKMATKPPTIQDFSTLFDRVVQSSVCSYRQKVSPLRRTQAVCQIFKLIYPSLDESMSQVQTTQLNAFKLIMYLTQDSVGKKISLDDLPVGLSIVIIQIIHQVKLHPPNFFTEDICEFVGREDLSKNTSLDQPDNYFDTSKSLRRQKATSRAGDIKTKAEEYYDDCDGLDDVINRSQPLFPSDRRMKEVARLLRSSRPLCLKIEKSPDSSDLDYAQQQQARLLLLCKRSMALSVARGMVTLGNYEVSNARTQIWRLQIPRLPLQGRKPPTNAIVELDLSGYAKELTYWPQFHNGCATGLRLAAHDLSGVINRHWIKYHRPTVNNLPQQDSASQRAAAATPTDRNGRNLEEAYAAHAGLLLGIGLRGHLKCLSMADVYNYLSLSNEMVTVAIMLGMASTAAHCRHKRTHQSTTAKPDTSNEGSPASPLANESDEIAPLDHFYSVPFELESSDKTPLLETGLELALERSVSKMLCLHVPSLLPSPFGGFSVPASTQIAALLGLGILYQGTGFRLMTELLLTEIARSPTSAQFVENLSNAGLSNVSFDQIESYALAAGMALGLITLGRGQTTIGDPGLADLEIEQTLHRYIVGEAKQHRVPNAAGSCLYRGRRWQAFGSMASGTSSAVNGGAPDNAASDSNFGASSDPGRETKYFNNRTGNCGGCEYVNPGVTACASALALGFMYIQTNNKAIAAQLAVPDTLILLNDVRPDILLVRTLAKNLVMWRDISPSTEWIDQHEVPAQLLHAYTSLKTHGKDMTRMKYMSSSKSSSDHHLICEAYANITAGACMSIGLRFAGTGDRSARATLRFFLLHFRELRSEASSSIVSERCNVVAAATQRATVERSLAVCAQALALVDAGSGHTETLSLLRSVTLRQRLDAAVSYGNHMALSMAIGLLFLGGGRATVSRSKEAIAGLVIALYPMFPANTADNKFHLQAFRHLYVLAVDTSRLLETVDVNSKMACAVQVEVDMLPEPKMEPLRRVLQSPCLLPDIATIQRLVIADSRYYRIKIMTSHVAEERRPIVTNQIKTANSLRLELLRNKNVVYLKRRHREKSNFLANDTNNSDDNRLGSLFCAYFTPAGFNDKSVRGESNNEIDQLHRISWGSSWWATHINLWALESVREEPHLLMQPYLNALHALFRLQQVPQLACAMEVIDLRLFSEQCCHYVPLMESTFKSKGDFKAMEEPKFIDKSLPIFEFGEWLSIQMEQALGVLWHRTSTCITSFASAQVQLLAEAAPSRLHTKEAQDLMDPFLASVLMRYFASTSINFERHSRPTERNWKDNLHRVLTACSKRTHSSLAPAQFQLSAFLDHDNVSEAEKTFWLKLVSFILFSM
ncbi:uncharacterized protein CCR75_005107 [Bremia lactucae]|uniref:Anaphase-promoting complex subunit 1 n=1 Tax=Bremia lactucae TaxID=4779 RepID=A0A976FPW4_BRELC|nr:hypothetical protein CCR75_005107 [Bremia lactucae]